MSPASSGELVLFKYADSLNQPVLHLKSRLDNSATSFPER